jgi:hypothetical protein
LAALSATLAALAPLPPLSSSSTFIRSLNSAKHAISASHSLSQSVSERGSSSSSSSSSSHHHSSTKEEVSPSQQQWHLGLTDIHNHYNQNKKVFFIYPWY